MIKRSLVLRQDTLNRENIRNRKIIRFLRNVFHISVGQVRYVGWIKFPVSSLSIQSKTKQGSIHFGRTDRAKRFVEKRVDTPVCGRVRTCSCPTLIEIMQVMISSQVKNFN